MGPVLSVAPDGQAAIAWVDESSGPFKVRASVRDPATRQWPTAHTPDPAAGTGSTDPSVAIDPNGNAVLLYDGKEIDAATYSAPSIGGVSIPTTGTVGSPVAFSATPMDVWSSLTTTWTFGDGTSGTGATLAHVYASPGQYQVTVTTTNLGGASANSSGTIAISAISVAGPILAGVSESHRFWARAGKPATISARRRRIPVGTTFSATLNEAATLRLSFSQLARGRKVGGRCVTATRHNRKHRPCKLSGEAGTLTLAGHAGINKVAFFGQISRTKRLTKGSFTASITATSSGKTTRPATLRFSIVK
jgi:PKD repeat protein